MRAKEILERKKLKEALEIEMERVKQNPHHLMALQLKGEPLRDYRPVEQQVTQIYPMYNVPYIPPAFYIVFGVCLGLLGYILLINM